MASQDTLRMAQSMDHGNHIRNQNINVVILAFLQSDHHSLSGCLTCRVGNLAKSFK